MGGSIKKYRNEWKYNLTNQQLAMINNRLDKIMDRDSHGDNGRYVIHSLYFDDHNDESLRDTASGYYKRYKYRIRFYDNDLSYITLEKKEKLYGRCHKRHCKLTIDEYNQIINKDYLDLVYDTDKQLLKEFIVDIMTRDVQPKVIVNYERIAYVEEITNVRITLDMKISAAYDFDNFLTNDYISFPVQESLYNVLEVKFDDILPSYIKNIVESYSFNQLAFSKYYYCRYMLDNYLR